MAKRANNFNAEEITLLKDIVLKKADVIENKKSDAVTWKTKKECWDNIAIEFNSNSLQCRSADMLRKKWDNIKKYIKDKVVGQRKYALGTGGGPSQTPANLTKEEEDIFSLIAVQATGTAPVIDCDAEEIPELVIEVPQPQSPLQSPSLLAEITEPVSSLETPKMQWACYTPAQLRTKRSRELTADKEDTLRRFRKRSHTAQLTNKVWTELAEDKKTVAKLKAEKLAKDIQLTEALIEESLVRKRNTELQNILLELQIEIKKNEINK